MKNKILYLMVYVLVIAGLSSCEDDSSAGLTGITYYPTIEIAGDPYIYLAAGVDYVDAGASATENGVPIDLETSSNLDNTTPGTYSVSYTATNTDGFSKTERRTIIVYDANLSTDDLSGTYTANVVRNGSESYSGIPVTLSPANIPGVTGIYEISDWIAGFYAVGRDYGNNYAFVGLMQINGDNEVIELSMSNPWNDPFNEVIGSYDPISGVITYDATWASGLYVFSVDMTK